MYTSVYRNPLLPTGDNGTLYDPRAERDACGVGFVASANGSRSEVMQLALTSLQRLAHRGARAADGATGDGAGILTQIPQDFFRAQVEALGGPALQPGEIGVGVLFLPKGDTAVKDRLDSFLRAEATREDLSFYGWRQVPLNLESLGILAAQSRPDITQILIGGAGVETGLEFERRLYRLRRRVESLLRAENIQHVYFVSLSSRTMVYKGLLMAHQLGSFYPDLVNPAFATAFAVYHQRYSTNTRPNWYRAQPFRMMAHNGEINTLQGNINWMAAREPDLRAPCWETIQAELRPVVDERGSDSGMLDNVLELLTLSGRDIPHALAMLVPEAWEGVTDMDPQLKDFYRFHSCLMEPWDGPAGVAFSDGRFVGAALDRNGLRPLRYTLTKDGLVVAGSEAGTTSLDPARIKRLGKLGPGQMVAVDIHEGKILENNALKQALAQDESYGEWTRQRLISLPTLLPGESVDGQPSQPGAGGKSLETQDGAHGNGAAQTNGATHTDDNGRGNGRRPGRPDPELTRLQAAFGYTSEEITVVIRPMVETAKEPVGSMGDDTPHAVMSFQNRPLFHYFKQRFAEVTNPPIDHLRERLVFSLRTLLGPRGNLLDACPEDADLVTVTSPLLLDAELRTLEDVARKRTAFRSTRVHMHFDAEQGPAGLEPAVERLCREAEAAVDAGAGILILTDKGLDSRKAHIPSLLATGAVHHHLIHAGKRMRVSLVVESGEPREIHHIATLLGYGANAVNPYLALATVNHLANSGRLKATDAGAAEAQERYRKAFNGGLLKVMSRMGISTVDSYTGAQIFEAIGLNSHVIRRCFTGTPSRVEGYGYSELAETVLHWHQEAFNNQANNLISYGFYKFKRDGEHHEFSPQVVKALHNSVMRNVGVLDGDFTESYENYREFSRLCHSGPPSQLRDLLGFVSTTNSIPLDEVEPVEDIMWRFSSAHMSLGSLSPEAHEILSVAMNRIGGRGGSGEGGEDAARFGNEKNSSIKQVASGRFGVTPAYLASAKEIQIKMAQGSKPGEGGQIPGHKVTELIARLRHTVPGVALISPPPHHDIYSIEDLAQLIYDLKQTNPQAELSVKLVVQTGVGIIAAGVAKGYADIILLSGNSGGTGSSPLNSIKNAGLPWEIGLAETQQTLMAEGLRDRVALRVDGGLKTGRDIVLAALLGADQYSFGTAALVSAGCIMARTCHTNKCPVGIASQDPELRKKFPGTPEMVVAYATFVAQEIREILAQLGYRKLNDIIGRTELLQQVSTGHPAADRLDLRPLLAIPPQAESSPRRRGTTGNAPEPEDRLDHALVRQSQPALERQEPVTLEFPICNTDRTVGATLSYEIARRHGDAGLPPATIQATFRGTAGQSFGAFCIPGVRFTLIGQANDYVGKGMVGGEIVLRPDEGLDLAAHENVIAGNTVLYGAIGGTFYAAGQVGERFAIRNSGVTAVVEGTGDHACEYMTGGTVVILGPTGHNLGAGMTGGEAFVLDESGRLASRYNTHLIGLHGLQEADAERLHGILSEHQAQTGSRKAAELLAHWDAAVPRFWRAAPLDEVREIASADEGTVTVIKGKAASRA